MSLRPLVVEIRSMCSCETVKAPTVKLNIVVI